jgi:hypothetical protein
MQISGPSPISFGVGGRSCNRSRRTPGRIRIPRVARESRFSSPSSGRFWADVNMLESGLVLPERTQDGLCSSAYLVRPRRLREDR